MWVAKCTNERPFMTQLVYPPERTLGTVTLVLGSLVWLGLLIGTMGMALVALVPLLCAVLVALGEAVSVVWLPAVAGAIGSLAMGMVSVDWLAMSLLVELHAPSANATRPISSTFC